MRSTLSTLRRAKSTASGRATLTGSAVPASRIVHFAWPEKLNREDHEDLKEDTSRSLRSSWFKSPRFASLCGAGQSHAFQARSITSGDPSRVLREPSMASAVALDADLIRRTNLPGEQSYPATYVATALLGPPSGRSLWRGAPGCNRPRGLPTL
jgi:hypothetical protein